MSHLDPTKSQKLLDAIGSADPLRVGDFLLTQGWKKGQPWRNKGFDWTTPENEHVLVPTDPTLQHYPTAIKSVFEILVSDQLTFEDVVAMASGVCSDIIRRRIDDPATKSGSCSLAEAHTGYSAMTKLLSSSSKRYAQKTGIGKELPKSYIQQCRAGQTELGSYVMRIYAPVLVSSTQRERRAFGRQSTIAAAENVTFLADEAYEPGNPLPAEMDWHVAESIASLKSPMGMWGEESKMSVRFVKNIYATEDQVVPENDFLTIPMKGIIFDRAESIYKMLKNSEMFERVMITGHITDLHKDVPNSTKQERRITVRASFSGRDRNVTLRLMPADYRKAILWHDSDSLVRVDVKIDKRWQVWTAAEYYSINSLVPIDEESSADLFVNSEENME